MKESNIVHDRGEFWVCSNATDYTVYKNVGTHSKADSSYKKTNDGLSLAKARCNYLAGDRPQRHLALPF